MFKYYYTEADFDNWEDENAKRKLEQFMMENSWCGNPSKITRKTSKNF